MKLWYIYTTYILHIHHEILFSHKINEIMSFAALWIDQEIVILSEVC